MDGKKLALTLAQCYGVSGDEQSAAHVAASYLKGWGEVRSDALGNLICTLRAPKDGGPHMMLCAHMDEIGMIVTHILPDGFLRVAAVGGVDRRTLLASPVKVLGREKLDGVVCSIPPHLQRGDDAKKIPPMEEIAVDVGLSFEQAKEKISLGDRVVVCHSGAAMGEHCISSKALDNRAGCAAVIRAAELLKDEELTCGLSVVLSTREELACNGAKTGAFGLCPTHAIAVDVSFALTDDAPKEKCGELGKGPMIGVSPVLSREMSDGLIRCAKDRGLPYQLEVMAGPTSTDADVITLTGSGVRCGLLSIPLRYMHTPAELVDVRDIESCAALMAEYIIDRFGGTEREAD
ncbi:M42 family metallopeptidase [Zongyangia hominis]|uniref:M20/M25/M40 family metallo-hydrolase n=1 Tax=Zongyangia hominis TaxID=2763677 RepID=A0A926EEK8_9FIRM|nr:M20/M25/M40 family metallo-hydrolase [Zongyangia hominis]MBC8570297.1 M20/M25/M40 family metallo-hydrolase [Zongyangia hominis]